MTLKHFKPVFNKSEKTQLSGWIKDLIRLWFFDVVCVSVRTVGGLKTVAQTQGYVGSGQELCSVFTHGHHTLGQRLRLFILDTHEVTG